MSAYPLDEFIADAVGRWEPPRSAAHRQIERLHRLVPADVDLGEALWAYLGAIEADDRDGIERTREPYDRAEAAVARELGPAWRAEHSAAVAVLVRDRAELGRRRRAAAVRATRAAAAELLDSDGIARNGWELVDELVDAAEHMSQLLDRHDRLQEAIVVLAGGDVEVARGLDKAAGGRSVWEALGLLAWRIEDITGRSEWPDAATTLDELRRRVAEERRGRG